MPLLSVAKPVMWVIVIFLWCCTQEQTKLILLPVYGVFEYRLIYDNFGRGECLENTTFLIAVVGVSKGMLH